MHVTSSFHAPSTMNLYSFPGSDAVIEGGEGLTIGAFTTFESLFNHPAIQNYSALYMALRNVSNPVSRRLKMIGKVLNPDVSSQGVAAALMAHGAEISIVGPGGSRSLNLHHYFSLHQDSHALHAGEKVKSFFIPAVGGEGSVYQSVDYLRTGQAVCGVAAWAQKNHEILEEVRIVLSGCTAFPIYLERISGFMQGHECNPEKIEKITQRLGEERLVVYTSKLMIGSHLFNLSKTLIKRALMTL